MLAIQPYMLNSADSSIPRKTELGAMVSTGSLLFAVVLLCAQLEYLRAVLKGMDDSVLFRIDWRLHSAMPEHLQSVKADPLSNQPFVFISSGNDEKYLCAVPEVAAKPKRKIEKYSGPSPAQLIESLLEERVCSYWLDLYWTYELCHGRYVLQYHDDKESPRKPRLEFYLGNYGREQSKLDDKDYDELNPPTRKIDDQDLPYYPVTYRKGTVCDVTGKPRTAIVIYVCKEDAKDQVHSFAETASCVYEMVVMTRRLCSHPSFHPISPPENEIVCYARNAAQTLAKPSALITVEKERTSSIDAEYGMIPPQSLVGETLSKQVLVDDGEDEDEEDFGTSVITPKGTSLKSSSGGASSSSRHEEREGPGYDAQTIFQENLYLLSGKQCLYGGGNGWWKYEFCYGRTVTQFHEDPQNGRTEILLGVFNADIHKHWIGENQQKHPLKIDGKIHQVSHLYTGGDFCEKENVHRSVEVRIRCRPSQGSQSAVTLFLLEPHTCQYVLGVESPRFCDILQYADQYGLIVVPDSAATGTKRFSDSSNDPLK